MPVLFLKTNISVQLYILIHIPVYIYFCIINLLLKRVMKHVYQNKSTGTRTGICTQYTKKFSATLLTKKSQEVAGSVFSSITHFSTDSEISSAPFCMSEEFDGTSFLSEPSVALVSEL